MHAHLIKEKKRKNVRVPNMGGCSETSAAAQFQSWRLRNPIPRGQPDPGATVGSIRRNKGRGPDFLKEYSRQSSPLAVETQFGPSSKTKRIKWRFFSPASCPRAYQLWGSSSPFRRFVLLPWVFISALRHYFSWVLFKLSSWPRLLHPQMTMPLLSLVTPFTMSCWGELKVQKGHLVKTFTMYLITSAPIPTLPPSSIPIIPY